MGAENIQIRTCHNLQEYDRCVELQQLVWGFTEAELVPKEIMVVAAGSGGQVFGAFDGEQMVGFLLGFAGYRKGCFYLHSHMLAVLPDYRDKGLGRQLKLKQREDALARGADLVEWTFDPLELKNAYFNIERLGAIVRRYIPNKYGRTTSPLHGGLPTDRLVAEWWLGSPRVEAVINGQPPARSSDCQRIALPAEVGELKKRNPQAAERLQTEVREQFQHWLGRGYAVTGFALQEGRGLYLLEPTPAEIPR